MTEELWSNVERYISDRIVHPDGALNAALAASDAAGLPSINVSPNQGKLLQILARPFDDQPEFAAFTELPPEGYGHYRTF